MTGIDPTQLRVHVIRPALERIGLWSAAAEDLVLGTAAVESGCGRYLVQVGGGPALGIFQMELATHDDLWENYLAHREMLADQVARLDASIYESGPSALAMVYDLRYAAAMCRVHYRRVPAPLPAVGDVEGYARYWKQWYNTPLGAGTPEKFVAAWRAMGV